MEGGFSNNGSLTIVVGENLYRIILGRELFDFPWRMERV